MLDAVTRSTTLITIAREAIAREARPQPARWDEAWLRESGACFVTLRLDDGLRGCVGSVDAHRALGDDVAHNAFAAAYRDSRFDAVSPAERERLVVEVSVLGPRAPLAAASEQDALAALRPGIDGIYFEYRHLHATFLPQVWDNIPDPLDFLCELRRKAGLPTRFWDDEVKLSRYTVEKHK